ncbi:DUF819 family protein [Marinilabiliaceae bacterium ANBcel2]|nr:DUF819 family protein [Marinilabiliaceae bacterium ANBcel2]
MILFFILFYLFSPAIILFLCHKFPLLNRVGSIVIAYVAGFVAGNIGIAPCDLHSVQNVMTKITIPMAIPLMLFSTNLKALSSLARPSIVSLAAGMVSVIIMIFSGHWIFYDYLPEPWRVSGLMVGVFTGGTPNLASLKFILDADENIYLLTHSADMFIGVFYLLFLMWVGKSVFSFLLGEKRVERDDSKESDSKSLSGNTRVKSYLFAALIKPFILIPLLRVIVLAALIVAISAIFALLFNEGAQMAVTMLTITSLSLLAALIKRVNRTRGTFDVGMYFVLIFSVVVASMGDISNLVISALPVVYYAAWVVMGSLILQVILSRIFKIDSDTLIITSTALICSPPFVPVIAAALNNRKIVVPGLTIGIIGYALGNYLGYIIAHILKAL